MLITEEYRQLNSKLHDSNKSYGTSGHLYHEEIRDLASNLGTTDILDYGCGKSTLAMHMPFRIKQYDPAVLKYSTEPKPADLVVCTDVLEHIEPDCLTDVLKHISELTIKVAYFVISTVEAKKFLEDGRNAHLIIGDVRFWVNAIVDAGLSVRTVISEQSNIKVICTK